MTERSDDDRDTVPPRGEEEEITQIDVHLPVVLQAPPRDRIVLFRLDGFDAGRLISVGEAPLLVGRSSECGLVLRDRSVSRRHAQLVRTEGGLECEDLGSEFGTHVNGMPHRTGAIRPGDMLQFGQLARFSCDLVSAHQEDVLRRLYESSSRDVLTQAFTRQYLVERLASECAYATRHEVPLSLLLFDLDHFKRVNDQFGHPAGDQVLQHVAALVHQRLRREDIFARYGGEEFAVLLRRSPLPGAAQVAERTRVAIASHPVYYQGHTIAVTISIGCAAWDETPKGRPEELVQLADTRLYRAKGKGRNRVVF